MKKQKTKTVKRERGRPSVPKEILKKMKGLLKKGLNYSIVAAETGVSIGTVCHYNKEWKL